MADITMHIAAAPEAVWSVLGEAWGEVHRVLPSLSDSRLLTDGPPGLGSRRRCTLATPVRGMEAVEEELVAWEEGRSFTYLFHDAPWPIRSVRNEWRLEPEGEGTRLTLSPSLRIRGRGTQWLAPVLLWFLSRPLEKDLPEMRRRIEAEARSSR